VAASTNYVLRVSGTIRVWPHGQLNIGTVSTPIPDTSTAVLELDCAADNDFQIIVHGGNSKGWTAQGSPRTAGKLHVMALLNTDEAAGQTTLGVDRDTGWKSGDSVWIASTTRTASQAESKVLNADAGASSIVITVALANAHSGTSPTQAEVVNMTRNVKVRSVTSGTEGAIIIFATAFCDFDWVEFNNLGNASATAMEARTNSSGQFTMDYCSFAEWATRAFFIGTSTDWTNVAMRNTVFATSKAGAINTIEFGSSTDGTWANRVFDNLTMVRGSGEHLEWSNPNSSTVTVTNLRASGSDTDAVLVRAGGAFSNWIIHSNAGDGVIDDSEGWGIFIQGIYCWRNNATGFHISKIMGSTILDTGQLFGNNGTNLSQDANTQGHHFKNLTLAGDTSFATTNGWSGIGSSIQSKAIFEGCTFGVVSGIFTAHTNDLNNNANSFYDITFRNTVLASATEFNGSNGPARSVQRYERVDGNTNVHKVTWPNFGTRSYETTEFTPLSPSQKLAPAGAYDIQGNHLTSSPFRVRVNSGSTVSVAVYVRKDASYAGIAPRLVLKSNAALGVTSDTLLDTFASPINTWEQLSGTTPAASEAGVFEFEIQVTGTGGAVYVDAWSAS
jgi:hypothetical protein